MNSVASSAIVGILYGGELGSSLGRLLGERGIRVVTTAEGRSERTVNLAREAGLNILSSFEDVVFSANIVLSVVIPSAAVSVARRFAETGAGTGAQTVIFVDVNSISPHTAKQIEAIVGETGAQFCDAAVQGLASKLKTQGTIFLSGSGVADVAALFSGAVRACDLGAEAGRASLMKMLLGGFSKGLTASFLTLALLARSSSILDEFLAAFRMQYPDIAPVIQRLVPTLPQHTGRRAEEMEELAVTLQQAALPPRFADAARRTFADLARCGLKQQWVENERHDYAAVQGDPVRRLIELVHRIAPFDPAVDGTDFDALDNVS